MVTYVYNGIEVLDGCWLYGENGEFMACDRDGGTIIESDSLESAEEVLRQWAIGKAKEQDPEQAGLAKMIDMLGDSGVLGKIRQIQEPKSQDGGSR